MPALLPRYEDDISSEGDDSTIGGSNNSTISEDSLFVFEGVHKLEREWNDNINCDNTDSYSLPELKYKCDESDSNSEYGMDTHLETDSDETYMMDNNDNFIFTDIAAVEEKANKHDKLSDSWLLLDSQSTVSIMCNGDLVTNIRKANSKLHMGTYG
eukprot:6338368-Ditylum_brightwellii.AAC.1